MIQQMGAMTKRYRASSLLSRVCSEIPTTNLPSTEKKMAVLFRIYTRRRGGLCYLHSISSTAHKQELSFLITGSHRENGAAIWKRPLLNGFADGDHILHIYLVKAT